jgi:hypothetical protein
MTAERSAAAAIDTDRIIVGKTAIFQIMTSYSGARIVLQGSAGWRRKITVSPAQKTDCRARDKKKPCPSAFRHSSPLSDDTQITPPNVQVLPYPSTGTPPSSVIGPPHAAFTSPRPPNSNVYPHSMLHPGGGGVVDGPERSRIVHTISLGCPLCTSLVHRILPEGILNGDARAEVAATRPTVANEARMKAPL